MTFDDCMQQESWEQPAGSSQRGGVRRADQSADAVSKSAAVCRWHSRVGCAAGSDHENGFCQESCEQPAEGSGLRLVRRADQSAATVSALCHCNADLHALGTDDGGLRQVLLRQPADASERGGVQRTDQSATAVSDDCFVFKLVNADHAPQGSVLQPAGASEGGAV
jgi:hypothetical protein